MCPRVLYTFWIILLSDVFWQLLFWGIRNRTILIPNHYPLHIHVDQENREDKLSVYKYLNATGQRAKQYSVPIKTHKTVCTSTMSTWPPLGFKESYIWRNGCPLNSFWPPRLSTPPPLPSHRSQEPPGSLFLQVLYVKEQKHGQCDVRSPRLALRRSKFKSQLSPSSTKCK